MKACMWLTLCMMTTSLYAMEFSWPELTHPSDACLELMKTRSISLMDSVKDTCSDTSLFDMYSQIAEAEKSTDLDEWNEAFALAKLVHGLAGRDDQTVELLKAYYDERAPKTADAWRKTYWNRIADAFQATGMRFNRQSDPSKVHEFFEINREFANTSKNFATLLAAFFLLCHARTIASL